MKSNTIVINKLWRTPTYGPEDTLNLKPGVNVIYGLPQSGKTKWLEMLDFLLGDPAKPESALGGDIAKKYDTVEATITVAGTTHHVARRWKQKGARGKTFIDDVPYESQDFSLGLLRLLGIPTLRIPKGNPAASSNWPSLSWRELYRHMYRRQLMWSGVAPQQPEATTRACVTLFLGLAELLYPEEFNESVGKRVELQKLESELEQFNRLLGLIFRESLATSSFSVALTRESIETELTSLQHKRKMIQARRDELSVLVETQATQAIASEHLATLSSQWERSASIRDSLTTELRTSADRIQELERYRINLLSETRRLERVKSAGKLFADLKVTNCPLCDQSIERSDHGDGTCQLCQQSIEPDLYRNERGLQRVQFEELQISGELQEVDELIATLRGENEASRHMLARVESELGDIELKMIPFRTIAATIVSPEIRSLDSDAGRIEEQVHLLGRLISLLDMRDELIGRIDDLSSEIVELDTLRSSKIAEARFQERAQTLSDGMNSYLNTINRGRIERWTGQAINVRLSRTSFQINVGEDSYNARLGGSRALYLWMSYHYGLMALSNREGFYFPGLLVIDIPPVLNAESIRDEENFAIEPFIELQSSEEMQYTQTIVAGAAFEGLEGVNRIHLTTRWD